jgi:hypothetical protein
MAFSITGQIKVATLKKRFLKEFGLTLRVYDGRSFADEGQTISQIRKKKGSGDLSVRKSMKVGTLEDKIESEFGIKVQIAGSDDSYLCENELTLASAHEKDQKRINKKDKKSKAVKSDSPITDKEYENTVDKTSESTLTEDQIKEFKEAEEEAEGCHDFRFVANDIAEAGDKEWAKKIYIKAEENPDDSADLQRLAESLCNVLGEKEWAKKVYIKAEDKAEDSGDFSSLADSIHENLGDKEWAKKVYIKAEDKAEDFSDFRYLADGIYGNISDKEWAKKVYIKAEDKAEDFSDFLYLADSIYGDISDKEWAKKVYIKAEDKAEDCSDFWSLADSIHKKLGDKEWAKKVYIKAEDNAKNYDDFILLADSIYEDLEDKGWATKLYKKVEDKAEESSDFRFLANSIHENLGDKEWATKLYKKAEDEAEDSGDFSSLADSIHENLGDKEWATKLYKKEENQAENSGESNGESKGDVQIIIQGRRITTFSFACLDDKYVEDIKKAIKFTDGLDEVELLHSILMATIAEDFDDLKSEIDIDKIEENCPTLYKLLNNLENSDLPESDKIEKFITPYPEPILYMESGHLISITIDGETKVDKQPLGEFLNINDEGIELDEVEGEEDLDLENSVIVQKAKEFCNAQEKILGLDPENTTVYKCNNHMMLIESCLIPPKLVKMQKNENQITIPGEVNGYVNFYLNDKNFDLDKLTFVRNNNYDEWISTDIVANYFCYDNKIIKKYDFDQHNFESISDYGADGSGQSLKFYLEG